MSKQLRALERKADGLWQEAVMLKWHGQCAIFPSLPASCGHHIIPRAHKDTRHKLMNGIALSLLVHQLFHAHPTMLLEWLRVDEPTMMLWHEEHKNGPIRTRFQDDVRMDIAILQQAIRDLL